MPGWYIHLEVAKKIAEILPTLSPDENDAFSRPGLSPQDLAKIIGDYPNYYALGALGPDIFYFLPDFKGKRGNFIAEAASFIVKLYALIDENIVTPWENIFAPLSEDSSELVSRLTGGLSDQLGQLCQYASAISMEAIFDLLSIAFPDWFGLLGCGPGAAFDDSLFFWSDMFHYRRTNEFACDLFQHAMRFTYDANGNAGPAAQGSPGYAPGLAFALGWMTHIGTDVTGHAFTNEKVGGPYRLHWQRHHLVENHMDAYVYNRNHQGDPLYNMEAASALHFWIQFREDAMPKYSPKYNYLLGVDTKPPDPDPNAPTAPLPQYPTDLTSRAFFDRHQIFNVDSTIPPELVALLRDVMKSTFYDRNTPDSNDSMPTHPMILAPVTGDARPDLDLMNANFWLLYEYVKLTTTGYYSMPRPVPPDLIPDNLDPPIPPTIDDPPGLDDPALTFLDVVLGVAGLVAYIGDWLLYVVSVLPGLIADLATYPARVVLYQFEMGFYLLWKSLRYLLVVEGFDLPEPDEIDLGLMTIGNSSKGVSDDLLGKLIADAWGGLFGYGAPPPSPDEPIPDPDYPRDTVVDEQNLIEQLVGDVAALLDPASQACTSPDVLGPNNGPLPSEYLSPWRYPVQTRAGNEVLGEPAHTAPGPYRPGATPEFLAETQIPGTDQARKAYEAASTPASTDVLNDRLGQDVQHIAYIDGRGQIQVLSISPGQKWSAEDITVDSGAPAAVPSLLSSWTSVSDNAQHIAYNDDQGHLQVLSVSSGQKWSAVDVNVAAGLPTNAEPNPFVSWVSAGDNAQHIGALDAAGVGSLEQHVFVLSISPGQNWTSVDVTVDAGAPNVSRWFPRITSWMSSDGAPHIAYIDDRLHIEVLSSRPGPHWSVQDVTAAAGAPAIGLDYSVTSWTSSDGAQHIAYIDDQGNIQALSLNPGQSWSVLNVTLKAGAPAVAPPARMTEFMLTSWTSSDGAQHIAYIDNQGHIQAVSSSSGQDWSAVDVTHAAGTPALQQENYLLLSWASSSDNAQHIAYFDGQGHIQMLSISPGQNWSAVDVTFDAGAPTAATESLLTRWVSINDDSLGDPIHYSLYTIGVLTRDTLSDPGSVASFNLDSDRGYGYKCWDYDRISGYVDEWPVGPTLYSFYANSVPLTRYAVPCTPPRGFRKYSLCPDGDTVSGHNPTLDNDPSIGGKEGILSGPHDYHPLKDLRIHYLTRFLSELTVRPAHGKIVLRWKPMSGAVTYNLYRSAAGSIGSWTKIPNVTSPYVDSGLGLGTTYFYHVTGVDAAGTESPRSAQAVAIPGQPTPGAPTNLAVAAGLRQAGYDPNQDKVIEASLQVTLTWDGVPGADGYIVYRKTDHTDWAQHDTPAASPYMDIDDGRRPNHDVHPGTTYYYYVTAVSHGRQSSGSLVAGATPEFPRLQYPRCDHMIG